MDERGYCRIQGRLKDMIIRGGENIYPREIEAVLYDHPKERLAAYKAPRTWVFVDTFPLTGSGKVQKFVLREQYEKGELG